MTAVIATLAGFPLAVSRSYARFRSGLNLILNSVGMKRASRKSARPPLIEAEFRSQCDERGSRDVGDAWDAEKDRLSFGEHRIGCNQDRGLVDGREAIPDPSQACGVLPAQNRETHAFCPVLCRRPVLDQR